MSSRFLAIGVVGILTGISAVSAVGPVAVRLHASSPGKSFLHVVGGRSPQQRDSASGSKFDAALADISRHAGSVRPDHALQDFHALNPAVRFIQSENSAVPLVSIDAVTRGDPQRLKTALVGLGLQKASQYSNDVGGWLPVDQLQAAAALGELHSIRAAMWKTRAAVALQGDFVQHSDTVRSANALDGAGITVGILSDSYNCYAVYAQSGSGVPASGQQGYEYNGFGATAQNDIASGALPSTVELVVTPDPNGSPGEADCLVYGQPEQLPFTDEGRAMLQIVHAVAPGATLAFHTAVNSEADFANGILALASSGAKVIADDVGYFDEPFFQDGIVAQAIDTVEAQGVAYFSAAGNNGTLAYDNNAPKFTSAGTGQNAGELLLNFDTTNATNTTLLPVTIPALFPGEFVAIVVEWDQPYVTGAPDSGGSANQINLCIQATGTDQIINYNEQAATCSGPNAVGTDPYQVMLVANPANNPAGNTAAETINIVVGLVAGDTKPGRIKVVVEDDGAGSTINQFATHSATLQGHPGAAGAAAVGAAFFLDTPACGTTPPVLETFSSSGGDPILFDANGTPQAPVVRQKPDFVGPDGVNNTMLGFTLASGNIPDNSMIAGCQNNASFPNFFGTSGATPHAAAIAALFLQANPALTPTQVFNALRTNTLPMGGAAGYNTASGFGFIQANLAAAAIPAVIPAVPTLSLGSSSIMVGNSTTLNWSSANNQGCTAGGGSAGWSGAVRSSGSQALTPSAAGTNTYTLFCTNAEGASPTATVMLTVTAAASGGSHGGGAIGLYTLLGLMGLAAARTRRALRAARGAVDAR